MATANPTGTRAAYPAESGGAASTTTHTEKGISLARGPALILGTILTAAGLYLLYKARTFPPFSNFTGGDAPKDGDFIFGLFGANGWTAMLTAVGGGLLLFGAAQHLLAKTMSLIVGVALAVAAVTALISGNVLGMAAANGWTELGWGACAVILLFNTLVPRRRRTVVVADEAGVAHEVPAGYDRRPVAAERAEPVGPTVEESPTAVRHDEAPTTAVRRDEEATAVRHDEAPTAVRRDEEATAAPRDEPVANTPPRSE